MVKELGLSAYLESEEKKRRKAEKKARKRELAEEKRERQLSEYGRKTELYKAKSKMRRAKKRVPKTNIFGMKLKKKRQGGKLSRKMRIKLL